MYLNVEEALFCAECGKLKRAKEHQRFIGGHEFVQSYREVKPVPVKLLND